MHWTRHLSAARIALGLLLALSGMPAAVAQSLTEYQLKAGVLYNFIVFTTWPELPASALTVCVYGPDPFGIELDKLRGKKIGERQLAVQRVNSVSGLGACQVVFISQPVLGNLPRVLDELGNRPVLTVSDAPGGSAAGTALNMELDQGKVKFQANLPVVRATGLVLSSKLLRLAGEVIQ